MKKPLDELYLTWLYSQVADVEARHPSRTYWKILKKLYTKEFIWLIPNDDNRIEDGRDLRYEFIDEKKLRDVDQTWLHLGCSMLELLIGLSRRLAFETDSEARACFWELIKNVGLEQYNDSRRLPEDIVDEALDNIIWRTYNRNGRGGLFPLRKAHEDQREVEIWYQLSAYVLENS